MQHNRYRQKRYDSITNRQKFCCAVGRICNPIQLTCLSL